MNKVVTTRTLAGTLPREVRGDIDPTHTVRVTVEDVSSAAARPRSLGDLVGAGRGVYGSTQEILDHVRELREDRDA